MRAEIRGRSGARIMVTSCVLPPVSRVPSLNLDVYALRGGDAARYSAPTSDARRRSHLSALVFESRWESDVGGDCTNGVISTFRKRLRRFYRRYAEILVAEIGISLETPFIEI